MPRPAPENGYKTSQVWEWSNLQQPETVLGYFIRVRTTLDEKGAVKSALYGKIQGDVLFYVGTIRPHPGINFTYYLNPSINSRNIEFDPKQNLLKNLSHSQQVTAP
jgi:hypothetical protein